MKRVLAFRHVPHESLGTLEHTFDAAGLPYEYVDLFAGVPQDFDPAQLAGLVVLGGPMNVDETEKYPFLATEPSLIEAAMNNDVPVLGICLGSQLVAKTLGAPVRSMPEKEIGWYEIEMTDAAKTDPLFAHLDQAETVFQWHGDTFDMPAGAVLLARSEVCERQAFRYGERVYALQFHMEVTAELIEDWLTEPHGCAEIAELHYIDPDEIRALIPARLPAMQAIGDRLFSEFARLCRVRSQGD